MQIIILFLIIFSASLGRADQPNPEDLITTSSDDSRLIYTFKTNTGGTNSHGYFDNEYGYTKANGIYRIVIIGDSIAQGQGVTRAESFPKMVERELNLLLEKKKYEVIVLARTGYSTLQEMVLFEEEAFLYDPDLIVWSYVLNDPAHPIFHDTNGGLGQYYFKPKDKVEHVIEKKKFILKEKLRGRNCPKEYHAFLQCVYWDQIVTDVHKIASITKAKQTPLIFLIHPVFQQERDFHQYTLAGEHIKLVDLALRMGFIPLDLLEAYKSYDPAQIKQQSLNPDWFDPWHPNAKGHFIIAEELLEVIKGMRKNNS